MFFCYGSLSRPTQPCTGIFIVLNVFSAKPCPLVCPSYSPLGIKISSCLRNYGNNGSELGVQWIVHLLKIIKISNPVVCPYSLEFSWSTPSVRVDITGGEHGSEQTVSCWPADFHPENSVHYKEPFEIFAEA